MVHHTYSSEKFVKILTYYAVNVFLVGLRQYAPTFCNETADWLTSFSEGYRPIRKVVTTRYTAYCLNLKNKKISIRPSLALIIEQVL